MTLDAGSETLASSVSRHIRYSLVGEKDRISALECFQAIALAVRGRLVAGLLDGEREARKEDQMHVCYLSAEHLLDRLLRQNLVCTGLLEDA